MTTVDDVRAIALSLPETMEKLAWGLPTFRVRNKIFASIGDDDEVIGIAVPRAERAHLTAAEPAKFFIRAGHDDNYDWMRVRLAAVEVEELRELLTEAWRLKAPKRLSSTIE
ncbi:MmcQ/YjbR family DNA-binding protein [Spongiactinospora sp. TRM90649]|uniref:MmcQ/YjbR family DNA-binding protein n=1 Tax=Spongiactinospora sp. TRM90649 TaxID=3031114 RepID=UPI0023F81ED1|nr:MmcQ/YjbR family DNA-binding protein [Spongiactinospora sp. TRM90649]MDF5754994.1 MmcQ/YjbR family DNA-binding protein [Spongiactinospora sp. TRM90649]